MAGISATAERAPVPAAVAEAVVATPFGPLYVACSDEGITESRFVRGRTPATARRSVRHPILLAALASLDAYFAGRPVRFDVPLVLAGTPLQVAVWRATALLPAGATVSYGEIAAAIGRPGAHRGVAAALAKTPLALFVPAHRVVGADRRIKGAAPNALRRRLAAFERLKVT